MHFINKFHLIKIIKTFSLMYCEKNNTFILKLKLKKKIIIIYAKNK